MKSTIMKLLVTSALFIFSLTANAQQNAAADKIPSGWTKVYRDSKMGYIDETGMEIIAPVYDSIGDFGEYCTDMAIVTKDGLMGLVDTDGNEMVRPLYELITKTDKFKVGWIMVKRNNLYGYIDCSGEEIVKPAYSKIEELNNTPTPAN